MDTTYNSLFDSVILDRVDVRSLSPEATAKAAAKPKAATIPAMPVSLWRHTQNENAARSRHGRVARSILGVISALGLGSVAYAIWQTGVLMSGSHLHDAVCAFLH